MRLKNRDFIKVVLFTMLIFTMTVVFAPNIMNIVEGFPDKPKGMNSYESFSWDFNSQITLPLILAPFGVVFILGYSKLFDFGYNLFAKVEESAQEKGK